MGLPGAPWSDHVALKRETMSPESRRRFASLQDPEDVFNFALKRTTPQDLDFLQAVTKESHVRKDSEQAARCRESGNSSFKNRDYTAATLHYSQGVCFAPRTSEQLSLCYANRSAALCHLQHYQESLDDIDRALRHGYPSTLQHKLQERRKQCISGLSLVPRREPDNPKPTLKDVHNGADPIDGVSPQVAVCFNPKKGRHLVVREGTASGDLILVDRPYSWVLVPGTEELKGKQSRRETEKGSSFGTEDRRCHRCLIETMCPVPCGSCSYGRYCSSVCRQEAWEEYHRWECPIGAELMVTGVMSQLALRMTLKAGLRNVQRAREPIGDKDGSPEPLQSPGFDSNRSPSDTGRGSALHCGDPYLSVYNLLHHLRHQSPALRYLCAATMATLYLKLSQAVPPPASWDPSTNGQSQSLEDIAEPGVRGWSPELCLLGSTSLRHMLQLRCNAQAVSVLQDAGVTDSKVQTTQEIRIATAIFPTLSLLNHSCCPNTSLLFTTGLRSGPGGSSVDGDGGTGLSPSQGVSVAVRAAKAIAAGQEILHCYGPHSARMTTTCERQGLLRRQYYFLCKCEACDPPRKDPGSESGWRGSDGGELQCAKCQSPLKAGGTGFVCVQPSCARPMSRAEVSRRLRDVGENLWKAADLLESDAPDAALLLLTGTIAESGRILSDRHPLQGEVADTMARAYATKGEWESAASQLSRSAAAVGSQYGEDSVELARQLFKLAQLHFNGGAAGEALSVIPRARRLLHLHYGLHCPELSELEAMEDCLR